MKKIRGIKLILITGSFFEYKLRNLIVMRKLLYLLMTSCISIFILSACANEMPTEQQQPLQEDSSANEIPAEQNQSLQESNSVDGLNQTSINNLLFSCKAENGKLIKLYDFGDTIQYSFGPENDPEIVLDVPRDEASTYQWAGVGRSIHYSVDIPNAGLNHRFGHRGG